MALKKIPENVKQFIFEHIDSVEQLEVLLFLRTNCGKGCTAEEISKELRSSASSVAARLSSLKSGGIIIEPSGGIYDYNSEPKIEEVLVLLADEYRVRKHLILELIFSPLKKMKQFADSFVFGGENKKGEDDG